MGSSHWRLRLLRFGVACHLAFAVNLAIVVRVVSKIMSKLLEDEASAKRGKEMTKVESFCTCDTQQAVLIHSTTASEAGTTRSESTVLPSEHTPEVFLPLSTSELQHLAN